MDRFRASVDAVRRGEEPPEDGYHGAYLADLAAEEGDPVPRMLERIEASLVRFRVRIDSWMREVDLVPEIPGAIAKIETYESEGTLWARTTAYGDDKDRPLLRSSDGTHLYYAADVAYLGTSSTGSTPPFTSSAPTITATLPGLGPRPRCSATTRPGSSS